MHVHEAIQGRYSVRRYADQPVSGDDLAAVLEAGRLSQSAKNLQDWQFVVVTDSGTRARLMDAAKGQSFVGNAPVVIVCCGVDTRYVMTCGQPSYVIDVAIAMENMALTAHERGLGTCWLGAFYEDKAKKAVGIPPEEDIRVVGLLTLGHPAVSDTPMKRRKPLDAIVRREHW